MLLRVPTLLYPGRFWAEQGAVYFHNAYLLPAARFFLTPDLGYYSLYDKVASYAAAHVVPLEWAPSLLAGFAFLAQMLPAVLLLTARVPGLETPGKQVLALAALAFVLPTNEVWLNTITSQFHLCVAAALLLVAPPGGTWPQVGRLAILLVAGLTGGPTLFLLPLFLLRAVRTRDARRAWETAALGVAFAVQGAALWSGPGRGIGFHPQLVGPILFAKQIALPITGIDATQAFGEWMLRLEYPRFGWLNLVFLLPHLAVLGLLIAYRAQKEALLLVGAAAVVVLGSFVFDYHSASAEIMKYGVHAEAGGRYYYAPNVLLWVAVLASPGAREPLPRGQRMARAAAGLLLALVLLTGAMHYEGTRDHGWFFRGPDWRVEAARWRAGERALRIWPEPWIMDLPHGVEPSR